ncbi:MAG: Ca-activated chloride channel [Verrucomicrobiota bacterium]|jgi:Ca-activated chloride channel family protein
MQFDQIIYLWLLAPALALLAAFFWWTWREKRRLIGQFISARLIPVLTLGVSPERQKARMILMLGVMGLLLLALARPQWGFSLEEAHSRGLDIIVAIDTSRSMLATDVLPNRLRRAQLAAIDLKRLAKSDRLGLVAFAGSAFLQCPLTLDDEAFRQSVEALDVNIIPQGGTALAEAIQTARSAFKEGNDNHKVLVLFTDGEDHDGHAVEAAKEAGKEGMHIFTIGVGTPNGDVLRTTDASGRSEFIKGPDGNAIRSQLDEKLLEEIAQATPGGFYRQLAGANTMNVLYDYRLAPLPKSDIASQKIKRPHERYQWLLGFGIVILLLEMLVPERKDTKRNPSTTRAARVAVLIFCMALPAAALAGPTKALKDYDAGKYEASQLEYERALNKKKTEDPRLHFNAGAAAFKGRDYEAAAQHLNSSLIAQDVPLQQRSYYNLGNTRYRLGEQAAEPDKKKSLWEQASKSFESAIKLDPRDDDAKFNLEFVKQKLEELKQQQQQQQKNDPKDDKKDDKKDQQEQKDPNQKDQKDQSKQGDSSKDPKNDEQKKDGSDPEKHDQQKKDEEKKKQEEQKSADQKKKENEEKQAQQGSEEQPRDEGQDEKDGAPQSARAMKMTPQQALQFLDMLKSEEKNLPFRPILRTNKQQRIFKDW